jgi:hypothetical protein
MVIEQGSSKATKKAYREFVTASKHAVTALGRLEKCMRADRREAAKFYVGVRVYCGLRKPKPGK